MHASLAAHTQPTLLDVLRRAIRARHQSIRTEPQYVYWTRSFVRHHGHRHPRQLGPDEVRSLLSMLASERHVSASTHNQALSALLFLYRTVLGQELPWRDSLERPRRPERLPTVLSTGEARAVLAQLDGEHGLLMRLSYGTGMHIMEALRLRVKDIYFDRRTPIVRQGKKRKDRALMRPDSLTPDLRVQLARSRLLREKDRADGRAGVELPDALARKYPRAAESWTWHWVFPHASPSSDPRSGIERRHQLFDRTFKRAFRRAVRAADVQEPAAPHTLRMRSPRTCCRRATTSAPCRNRWAIATSRRR
jgi:integron integrase